MEVLFPVYDIWKVVLSNIPQNRTAHTRISPHHPLASSHPAWFWPKTVTPVTLRLVSHPRVKFTLAVRPPKLYALSSSKPHVV